MRNQRRNETAIKSAELLLKKSLEYHGWFIRPVHQPLFGARGLYDLILINHDVISYPIFIRVECINKSIISPFQFKFNFTKEIFLTSNNLNMILFVFAQNGLIIYNPKKGMTILKQNALISSDFIV
jgi:hypothetical protein